MAQIEEGPQKETFVKAVKKRSAPSKTLRSEKSVKILSWNVNGMRSIMKKGFLEFVARENPDILCLQETRCLSEHIDGEILPEYHKYWNAAARKGYSGTAIFTKIKPVRVTCGMNLSQHDDEGRVITAEFEGFYLVNVYTPNSKRGLERLDYRTREWDVAFLKYLKRLEKSKPVVFCGDLNVAHTEIDLANPKANVKNHGFTPEERAGFDNLVKAGFLDTFRVFNKEGGHYTWWSQLFNARARNIGWRIDYFCISASLQPRLRSAAILKDTMGSDHCPVSMELSCSS